MTDPDLAVRARRVADELSRPVVRHAEKIAHHAKEAREWADAADREAAADSPKAARCYAEVSQAHSLAALAAGLVEGTLRIDGTVMHP